MHHPRQGRPQVARHAPVWCCRILGTYVDESAHLPVRSMVLNAAAGEGLEAAPSARVWHRTCLRSKAEGTAMVRNVTLLDLVNAVAEHARSEAEVIATVVWMVNGGHVRLCGTFKGARFDLTTLTA